MLNNHFHGKHIDNIEALFFDFDGVIADSLNIKAEAFLSLFDGLSAEQSQAIRSYFYRFTGRSRQSKLLHVHQDILDQPIDAQQLRRLSQRFQELTVQQVVACPEIPGTLQLLQVLPASVKRFVVSGTPEQELNTIVKSRGLAKFFMECRGTPTEKEKNIAQLLEKYTLNANKCLMIGDGLVDQQAAESTALHFIGMTARDQTHPFSDTTRVVHNMHALADYLGLNTVSSTASN